MMVSIEGIEIEVCRGILDKCINSISTIPDFMEDVLKIARNSWWHKKFINKPQMKHQLLKIGISACPNGCAKPQIKDLGLILKSKIAYREKLCNECLKCVDICKEKAILFDNELMFKREACIGCAECVRECEYGALIKAEIYFEVQVGGRLGRHPRFGTPILELPPCKFYPFFEFFIKLFEEYPQIEQAKELFNELSPDEIKNRFLALQNIN